MEKIFDFKLLFWSVYNPIIRLHAEYYRQNKDGTSMNTKCNNWSNIIKAFIEEKALSYLSFYISLSLYFYHCFSSFPLSLFANFFSFLSFFLLSTFPSQHQSYVFPSLFKSLKRMDPDLIFMHWNNLIQSKKICLLCKPTPPCSELCDPWSLEMFPTSFVTSRYGPATPCFSRTLRTVPCCTTLCWRTPPS